ncbi:uncharacterized protein isoform X1 [Choristoneura fumiferana]|uniref:uncharacterized protein isoform X1 n=1 Tax=Choristoneura fumiferana TaxID=7141 RepID=UPI003D156442
MQTKNNDAEFDKHQKGTGTWSSLDIFLFANGQKYSPPRKYNLRASELQWWDSTLNYLARSQYGSKHTNIELYSIDGTKIGGPLELSNGSAYVAVEPPDTFVQSGYEKYLIKATRSWEKRQEKRTSDNALSKPDKINVNNEILCPTDNNDSTNIQIIQDIRIQPATTTAASNAQDQTVIKVKSDSVAKTKPNGVANTIKQIPKRKSIVSQQRPSILRKSIVNPVSALAHKGSRDSRVAKVDLTKKKLDSSSKGSENVVPLSNGSLITTKITESKLESTNKIDSRTRVIQVTDLNESSDKKIPFTNTIPLAIPIFNNTLENKPAEISQQKDEVLEQDIMSVSFHSEENFQSICINANNNAKENLPITINDTTQAILNSIPNAVSQHSNFGTNQCALPSSTNDKGAQKNYVVSDSQTAENIIISVSPGETVKVKINVAFENSSCSTNESHLNQPSTSLATKSELEAPGRHFLEIRSPSTRTYGGETPTIFTKSWQTAFTTENTEEEINDVKLAVCRCNCCLSPDKVLTARTTPVYVDNNNYFILLPSVNNNEKINSCNCVQENYKNNNAESNEHHLILPKAVSSAVETASVKENMFSISKTSEYECSAPVSPIAKNHTSTYEYSQLSKYMESKSCTCDATYRNASDLIFSVPSTNNPKHVTDNSTQTNWDNILLEARLHKDGHYTFHMPPLDKIKI